MGDVVDQSKAEEVVDYPKIFCIDLDESVVNGLKDQKFNVSTGTLGTAINVPNEDSFSERIHRCNLNYYIPPDLHEYQIVVLNLHKHERCEYDPEENSRHNVKGNTDFYYASEYPQLIFDPRPVVACAALSNHLENIIQSKGIIILFADEPKTVNYCLIETSSNGNTSRNFSYSIYHCIPELFRFNPQRKGGREFIVEGGIPYESLLNKTIGKNSIYNTIFTHPLIKSGSTHIPDPSVIPLIKNPHGEIISFLKEYPTKSLVFVFPQITDKASFLQGFFRDFLPVLSPDLFPYHTKNKWLEQPAYYLPCHQELLEEKERIEQEYETRIEEISEKIEQNARKNQCLHDLLIGTDKELVKSIEWFLLWLEFKSVRNMDELEPEKKEEDIQVDVDDGSLLLIEVKGIGGTSTDDACRQVDKYVIRQSRGQNRTDVYGLYIVNHQKHLPPLERTNPPFKDDQIQDAVDIKRGLLTTWQLFTLYRKIIAGFISKEEARSSFLDHGLIQFHPESLVELGKPVVLFENGKIFGLKISTIVKKGDILFTDRPDGVVKAVIESIEVDRTPVIEAACGDVTLKVNEKVFADDVLYLKQI
jgi:hypothetical protein